MRRAEHLIPLMGQVRRLLKGAFVYLFLDFDGTLLPIADTPDEAVIPRRTRSVLLGLSKLAACKVAILSGRSLTDLSRKVGLKNIVYAGNHGFEMKGPGVGFKVPVSRRYRKIYGKIKEKLEEGLAPFGGVVIEDKGYCLAVHYRLADRGDIRSIVSVFRSSTRADRAGRRIRVESGKMMREVRPPVSWNKGAAALWLLRRQMTAMKDGGKGVLPVCIGDDLTDEDAFRALRSKGLTIVVGGPKKTAARFYLKDTGEVKEFLRTILRDKG